MQGKSSSGLMEENELLQLEHLAASCIQSFYRDRRRGDGPCSKDGYNLDKGQSAKRSRQMVNLLEMEQVETRKTIETLKKALENSRRREKEIGLVVEKRWKEKSEGDVVSFKNSVERQLKLIDRLLVDKKELMGKLVSVSEQLSSCETTRDSDAKRLGDEAQCEIAKHKKQWFAGEKNRRDAWEVQKLKEMKEATIKGLEPQIERIVEKHRAEKAQMELGHREAVDQMRKVEHIEFQGKLLQVREQCEKESDQHAEHERSHQRKRLQDQQNNHQLEIQELRSEHEQQLLAIREENELQRQQENAQVQRRAVTSIQAEKEDLKVKYIVESKRLADEKKRNAIEFKEQTERFESSARDIGKRHEMELKEVKKVVEGQIAAETNARVERERENWQRLKEKEAALLKKTLKERTEQSDREQLKSLEKQNENQQLLERQNVLQAELSHKEKQFNNLQSEKEKLQSEKEKLQSSLTKTERLLKTCDSRHEVKVIQMKRDLENLEVVLQSERADFERRIDSHRRREAALLARLENEVRSVVAEKDTLISQLNAANDDSLARETRLKKLLQQQREDLLLSTSSEH